MKIYLEQIEGLSEEVYGHVERSGAGQERLGRVHDVGIELPASVVDGAEVVADQVARVFQRINGVGVLQKTHPFK